MPTMPDESADRLANQTYHENSIENHHCTKIENGLEESARRRRFFR